MIEISEKEAIELFSQEGYVELVNDVFNAVKETPEFLNTEPMVFASMTFPPARGFDRYLYVEATAYKLPFGVIDFGIKKLAWCESPMEDEILDRHNEIIKLKQ